jgi:type IV secretory pathway VirB10-like protein
MKTFLLLLLAMGCLAQNAFAQGAQADQIKRRARATAEQNNARQGVPPPARPTPPPVAPPATRAATPPAPALAAPQPAATAPTLSTTQAVARLETDLAALQTAAPATQEQKQQLLRDIAQSARGQKPFLTTATGFVDALSAALSGQKLDAEHLSRFARSLEGVLNCAALSSARLDALIAEAQAALESGGLPREKAAAVVHQLRLLARDVRRGSGR